MPVDDVVDVECAELRALEQDDEPARQAAESLQRQLGDLELRDELARANFSGPGWDRFANELARYGHAVMMAWMWTGEIFVQCQKRNCPLGTAASSWTYEDRMGLANDTVAHAIGKFRDRALIAGKWSAAGGASLKTYFIGACVYAFPNFYRKWCTAQHRHQQLHQDQPALALTVSKTAMFRSATFSGIARFGSTTFRGHVDFESATFARDVPKAVARFLPAPDAGKESTQ